MISLYHAVLLVCSRSFLHGLRTSFFQFFLRGHFYDIVDGTMDPLCPPSFRLGTLFLVFPLEEAFYASILDFHNRGRNAYSRRSLHLVRYRRLFRLGLNPGRSVGLRYLPFSKVILLLFLLQTVLLQCFHQAPL